MSTSDPQQASTGAPRRTALLVGSAVLVVVVIVVLAVVLTRGDTAATEADLTEARDPTAGPSLDDSDGSDDSDGNDGAGPVLTADGLPGAQLGDEVADDDPGWTDASRSAVGTDADAPCQFVVPTTEPGAPGLSVAGWVVDGRLASVMVLQPEYRIPYVTLPYGVSMDEGLEVAAAVPDAETTTEELDEPARPGPGSDTVVRELRLVSVRDGDREVVYSDLGGDRGIEYVEVRDPAAADCVLENYFVLPEPPEAAPTLDADGWGEVRVDRPLFELVELGLVEPEAVRERGACAEHPATDVGRDDGLGSVSVLEGRVAGVAVRAGRTEAGLSVGDSADDVLDVYPDAVPDARSLDVQPSWTVATADGRRLQVTAVTGVVVPAAVDVYLQGVQAEVITLDLQPTACTG